MPEGGPLLRLNKVSRQYDSPDRAAPLKILDEVSLEVAVGQSLAVVGPSGSGKSTLLQIIGTLDRPTSGEVILGGQDLNELSDVQLAAVRNESIGFVFQLHYLLPQCTVLENVLVPTLAKPRATRSQSEDAEARAARLLKRVGLAERLLHRPGQLSGGERQRVAVVRALINRPKLLLADEPTGALDHASALHLGELLTELNQEEHVTLIVVTHALELARRMQSVLELKDGRLIPHKQV
ncbi:MAG TPA: ABC transporter ATP-binding protein [Patescibacteria group bacterium]|nr:ABC transporter ATP-binding protein [Patescibacteria group bacterium]